MKQAIANIYSQGSEQDGIKELTNLLESEGYEIVWQAYPNSAIIVKENGETE